MGLKKTELRIGNYIEFDGLICIVETIDEQGATVTIPKTKENEWIDLFQFSHITLTEEWFLKLGFIIRYFNEDKNKPLWWKVENNRHIEFYFEKQVNAYVFMINNMQYSIEIKYVHQLQNLYFALTNTELIWNGEK